MNDNFAENLAKLCQKADQPARVTNVAIQPHTTPGTLG